MVGGSLVEKIGTLLVHLNRLVYLFLLFAPQTAGNRCIALSTRTKLKLFLGVKRQRNTRKITGGEIVVRIFTSSNVAQLIERTRGRGHTANVSAYYNT